MKSNQKDIELLDAYLKGRLDKGQKSMVMQRLSNELELNEDLKFLKISAEAMRLSVLNEKLTLLKNVENEEKIKPTSWWKWLLVSVVGIIALYMVYTNWLSSENKIPEEYKILFAERFDTEMILHKTMRASVQSDEISAEQRRAYELYSLQLFDDAIPLLKDLWSNQNDTLALFYLGVSEIGVGDKGEGIQTLQNEALEKYSKQINIFINH